MRKVGWDDSFVSNDAVSLKKRRSKRKGREESDMNNTRFAGSPLPKPRRRASSLGLAAGTPSVGIRGIEVVQCVQDIQNTVKLVAGKPTIVRVYLDPASVSKKGTLGGELAWTKGGGEAYLSALNTVTIDPAAPNTLAEQRLDI